MRFGLRTKFFLYSNTLIFVTMTLVTVLGVIHERQARYQDTYRRARSIAGSLAIPITDALMYEDLGLVTETGLTDSYIEQILAKNSDLMRYVIVANEDGIVTHSNRWELLGEPFERSLSREAIGEPIRREELKLDSGERVLEVRTPLHISTRFWGSLAVGFSLEKIDAEVASIAQRAMLVAVVLMVANSALTAFYVETLIRPILHLYRTMKRAGSGDFSVRARVRRGDEVGELAHGFNRMMDELEDARERERIRQTQLGHTEKMAAVGTLAAGVAHEVNNPLGGILTCIENLRSDPGDEEMRERYLDMIHDGLKRIERTVQNLLDFSRRKDLRAEPTSINHNLRHVTELVAYQTRKFGIEVRFEVDPDEPLVMADHFQMEQMFLNLVLNAIQAMPEGGRLTFRTRVEDGEVIAEVHDTGKGIPQEIQERIFDPFFTTREVGQGTGLGLSVSDSIAAAHGGSISFESAEGYGTIFRVALPLHQRKSARKEG